MAILIPVLFFSRVTLPNRDLNIEGGRENDTLKHYNGAIAFWRLLKINTQSDIY